MEQDNLNVILIPRSLVQVYTSLLPRTGDSVPSCLKLQALNVRARSFGHYAPSLDPKAIKPRRGLGDLTVESAVLILFAGT